MIVGPGRASLAPVSDAPDRGSCRACAVRCERVVYPAHCVAIECPRLYAHEHNGVRWIGCIDSVFTCEVDVAVMLEVESVQPGFGALRADGAPRPQCKTAIDRTFPQRDDGTCSQPAFRTSHPEAPQGREPLRTRDV